MWFTLIGMAVAAEETPPPRHPDAGDEDFANLTDSRLHEAARARDGPAQVEVSGFADGAAELNIHATTGHGNIDARSL